MGGLHQPRKMSVQRISQRDIAERAGVHFTTVSLALRNSPTLPEATRQRIQNLAMEMGYRPDPMLSALQAYRKTVRTAGHEGAIAWINTSGMQYPHYFRPAQARCEELGYRLDEFSLSNLSTTRLSSILRARNIQGLLLSPQTRSRAHLNFDWENYSAVAFGYSLSRPRLHVVTNAQYGSSRMAVRALRKYGYRQIGFFTSHRNDERTDQNFSSGYLAEQQRIHPSLQIPMLVIDDTGPWKETKKTFFQWYKKYRPSVILAHYDSAYILMEELSIPYSKCGLAMLAMNSSKEHHFAGIDQNDELIGRTAVDFVVGMIHRNERGIPQAPLRILVEGKWVDGKTIFPQNLEKRRKANPGKKHLLQIER